MSVMLIVLSMLSISAQTNTQIIVQIQDEETPLSGASVVLTESQQGAITNFDGVASFPDLDPGTYAVEVSFVGFQTFEGSFDVPLEEPYIVYLKEKSEALDAVILQSSRSTRTVQKIPTRIEFIGGEELEEKAMMNATNISMVLRESTGIQMQQTSLSSANMNIRIQGLDGRYTQLLRDGFPLYGGFSGGLSIMQIPPLDLAQFEIIKGSSSTIYGGGAIAGLVNLVSKKPKYNPELELMFTQTHALGSTANLFFSQRNEKFGTTLYASGHYQKAYDPEDDGFTNLPETYTVSLNPKFFYYPSEATTIWLGLNGTYDDRIGGDITSIEEGVGGIHQYTEANRSCRLSSQAVYTTRFSNATNFTLKNSVGYFRRNLEVPDLRFQGEQWNTFTEASWQWEKERSDWILGANVYTYAFDEAPQQELQRDQQDETYGVFAKNVFDLSEQFILESGLRADYSPDWGFFPLPRIAFLYKNNANFSSRIGGGLGYKIPDIFTEEAEVINFDQVLPINKDRVSAERSYGVNWDVNYQTRFSNDVGFSANQLFYVTTIEDALLLNATSNGRFAFSNAPENVVSMGAETNLKFTYEDFRLFLNYAFIDTRLKYLPGNPQKPLTARHNAGGVLMYESDDWRLGFEAYYTGKQRLSNGNETTDFIRLGFLAMKLFSWGNVFVNFENFTDRRQSRFSPLVTPPHDNPEFPEIYAPTDGIIVSVGIILKPFS